MSSSNNPYFPPHQGSQPNLPKLTQMRPEIHHNHFAHLSDRHLQAMFLSNASSTFNVMNSVMHPMPVANQPNTLYPSDTNVTSEDPPKKELNIEVEVDSKENILASMTKPVGESSNEGFENQEEENTKLLKKLVDEITNPFIIWKMVREKIHANCRLWDLLLDKAYFNGDFAETKKHDIGKNNLRKFQLVLIEIESILGEFKCFIDGCLQEDDENLYDFSLGPEISRAFGEVSLAVYANMSKKC